MTDGIITGMLLVDSNAVFSNVLKATAKNVKLFKHCE